jgi:endonuclease I
MNKPIRLAILLAALATTLTALASIPINYYNNALGKSDEPLMTALRNIIYVHNEVSYSKGLLDAFKKADTDDEGYIIDIYSNIRYRTSDNGSSASHIGQGYNREHSFPRSWFNGEVAPMNTDVFHIYPTDIKVNSQRSNFPYGVCANGTRLTYGSYVAKGKLGTCTYPGYSGTVFEPDDEYKGDLARSYFYMVTCYKNELPSWVGSDQLNYRANKYKAFSSWTISMLMEWTRLDPVSEKEIKRNEAIYGIQGNRNPFIDHPELAEHIWGNKQGIPWNGSADDTPAAIISPEDGSIIDIGSTTLGTPIPYSIDLKGERLTTGVTMSMSDNEYFFVSASTFTASEVNNGTSFTITFTADDLGTFDNLITIGNAEATSTFTVRATAVDQDIKGDINGDGEVNIADVNAVINVILGDESSTIDGDVNGDGEVNIADVNNIIAVILGL